MARIAGRLALPRAGRDGAPEAGDAVIVLRRERRGRETAVGEFAPGVWLVDGRPGLEPEDIEQMRLSGVKLDPDLLADADGAAGSDGIAGSAGREGSSRHAGVAGRSGSVARAKAVGHGGLVARAATVGHAGLVMNAGMTGHAGSVARAEAVGHDGLVARAAAVGHAGLVMNAGMTGHAGSVARAEAVGHDGLVARAAAIGHAESARSAGTFGFAALAGGVRLFEVPVFHLKALAVRRIGPGAGLLPSDWDGPHPLRRRLEAAAIKALYAAGRDFGTVRLAASDDGAVWLAGPFGEPTERDLPLWAEAVESFRAELAEEAETGRRREILIGADPEFLLVGPDGRVVSASRYFSRDGAAGSDALRVSGQLRCPVAELRPDPAVDPDGLMRGIRGLLRRAEALTAAAGRPLRWLAGGMPVPGFALGGHLHLSIPPSARLLRVLDSCVALPLAAAEDARAVKRRPRYGALGDFRVKSHGFEYRTPPSWLVSPLAAQAAFAIALLAARHTAELAMLTGLPGETPDAMARRVHDAMRRVSGYAVYRRWIAPFFAALERGAVWREDADFRPKWGLAAREADRDDDSRNGTAYR